MFDTDSSSEERVYLPDADNKSEKNRCLLNADLFSVQWHKFALI